MANRRKRSIFRPSEKKLITEIFDRHRDILENKKIDGNTVHLKRKAWAEIEAEFNSKSSGGIPRNAGQLKKLYGNLKWKKRQEQFNEESQRNATGGVQHPAYHEHYHNTEQESYDYDDNQDTVSDHSHTEQPSDGMPFTDYEDQMETKVEILGTPPATPGPSSTQSMRRTHNQDHRVSLREERERELHVYRLKAAKADAKRAEILLETAQKQLVHNEAMWAKELARIFGGYRFIDADNEYPYRIKYKQKNCIFSATEETQHEKKVEHYDPHIPTPISDFKALYRFEEKNVQWLVDRFLTTNEFEETRGKPLSPAHSMKVCLRYLSDPGYQKSIGEELGVSQATVSRKVNEVVETILWHKHEWIQFPTTKQEIVEAKQIWQSKYKFPTAIGAVGCTYIEIMKPNSRADEYINRRGKATLNVQATCDAKEKFTSVELGWPGSVHNSRVWKNSEVCLQLRNEPNVVLLADERYGLEPCLMTPYRKPVMGAEQKYNKLLKKERLLIEQCFGQLKRRFPGLQYICRMKLENVQKIIVACVVLHNIAKTLGDPDFPPGEEPEEEEENEDQNNYDEQPLCHQGQEIRKNLSIIIISDFNNIQV